MNLISSHLVIGWCWSELLFLPLQNRDKKYLVLVKIGKDNLRSIRGTVLSQYSFPFLYGLLLLWGAFVCLLVLLSEALG